MYLEKQNVMYVIYVNSSLPILVHLKFLFTLLWYYNDRSSVEGEALLDKVVILLGLFISLFLLLSI